MRPLKAGDIIDAVGICSVRLNFGLAPKFYEQVLGKKVTQNVEYATPVTLDNVEL
ncbi:SAF domain-containing protein [Pelistega sp. MC2]|uniref:SAF domain-containing protein n=1 Tax=Pelistega sp. MC2 TaxID=1720297 RepID=UPI0015A40B89|nr:SAF domain-containing protein [Pelistega sp. MC2]